VIDKANVVGEIFNAPVFRVESLRFIPIHSSSKSCTEIEAEDKPYYEMIQKLQRDKAFYFSFLFDLSKNMQE